MPSLPVPDTVALAHSDALRAHIRDHLVAAGGWLSFADYMNHALYAPGLGYYSGGARKFGAAGDFVTAPELTPLFGQALANQVAQVLAASGGDVLELGAGSGRLAAVLLRALEGMGSLPERYAILELSADLRQRQQQYLEAEVPHLLNRVVWLDALPTSFVGLILGNEVLDALPVHLLKWRGGRVYERGVCVEGDAFGWQDCELSGGELQAAAERLSLDVDDYLSEISLAGPALVHSLGDRLEKGALLFIDYGFPRAEYYHPDRLTGTLMCHYRHHSFDDPFFYPGLTDITAHVDFTAIADAALEAGLEVLGYVSQAHFLINCGLLQRLERFGVGSIDYLRQTAMAQKLIQPSEMGELFKVIALGKGLDESLLGFTRGDRRHAL